MDVPALASDSHIDWWAGGAGGVVGAIIGSFVPLWSDSSHPHEESLGRHA